MLLNRYRDGKDSIGAHSDDEPELGDSPTIASISLGVTRKFILKPKTGGTDISYDLTHGSLLVMGGSCQSEFKHLVPKDPSIKKERINLTFRRVT